MILHSRYSHPDREMIGENSSVVNIVWNLDGVTSMSSLFKRQIMSKIKTNEKRH